ncbi:hypothetical protein N6H14_15870 [Paenibacillus sp. CC-CFT747]|nr:hypothetical protein N6H14_15870 [Paenibacillus sp. CC-CFT747]
MAVQQTEDIRQTFGDPRVTDGISVWEDAFDSRFYYDGDDLGLTWSEEGSLFKVWAPTSEEARLVLYSGWDGPAERELPMTRGEAGTWSVEVPGNLEGRFYTYKVSVGGEWREAVDPYARAVSVNGGRGRSSTCTKPTRKVGGRLRGLLLPTRWMR